MTEPTENKNRKPSPQLIDLLLNASSTKPVWEKAFESINYSDIRFLKEFIVENLDAFPGEDRESILSGENDEMIFNWLLADNYELLDPILESQRLEIKHDYFRPKYLFPTDGKIYDLILNSTYFQSFMAEDTPESFGDRIRAVGEKELLEEIPDLQVLKNYSGDMFDNYLYRVVDSIDTPDWKFSRVGALPDLKFRKDRPTPSAYLVKLVTDTDPQATFGKEVFQYLSDSDMKLVSDNFTQEYLSNYDKISQEMDMDGDFFEIRDPYEFREKVFDDPEGFWDAALNENREFVSATVTHPSYDVEYFRNSIKNFRFHPDFLNALEPSLLLEKSQPEPEKSAPKLKQESSVKSTQNPKIKHRVAAPILKAAAIQEPEDSNKDLAVSSVPFLRSILNTAPNRKFSDDVVSLAYDSVSKTLRCDCAVTGENILTLVHNGSEWQNKSSPESTFTTRDFGYLKQLASHTQDKSIVKHESSLSTREALKEVTNSQPESLAYSRSEASR